MIFIYIYICIHVYVYYVCIYTHILRAYIYIYTYVLAIGLVAVNSYVTIAKHIHVCDHDCVLFLSCSVLLLSFSCFSFCQKYCYQYWY